MGPADDKESDLELPSKDHRPNGQEDVVKGDGERGGELAAPENPGEENGKQRLEAEEGGETEYEADSHATGNGVGRVADLREAALPGLQLDG